VEKAITAAEKVAWFVDAAEFWLECDDEKGLASQQIRKAHVFVSDIKNDNKLVFRFKTCYARVKDSDRSFFEASLKYLELAQMGTGMGVGEDDLLKTLENAVTCAILDKPGPNRSRVLAMLMSDERSQQLRNYGLLEKMFKERVVRTAEVEAFKKLLAKHQNAEDSKGRTILQNSIMMHNMFAVSKIYNNITFTELGHLLDIKASEAEALAAKLIDEGRMRATIDQVDGVVEFEAATDSLHVWDDQITATCQVVNDVLEQIVRRCPQYKSMV